MKQFMLNSMDGKQQHPIRITRDFLQWKDGKCWANHCNNDIHIVYKTRYGNASHGYCFWCFRSAMAFMVCYGDSYSGEWVECVKDYKTKKAILKIRDDFKRLKKGVIEQYCKKRDR